ncbi:MAG: type II toxin-antitoxin system VapC family toxin [Alphaproteobacteria bacterium]|nr:type II toxin-antitoxin system VapC family toxin [Alphaproteobacteria bacterium]
MRVLLDTCVISEIRRPQGSARVKDAVAALVPSEVFISAITFGKLTKGIALLEAGEKKSALQNWLLTLEKQYARSILPVDLETVRLWGELTAQAQKSGCTVPACDGLIAATARRHGLHLMTRNITDFEATGAMLVDPWRDD